MECDEINEREKFILSIKKEYEKILCIGCDALWFKRYYKQSKENTIHGIGYLNSESLSKFLNINSFDLIYIFDEKHLYNCDDLLCNYTGDLVVYDKYVDNIPKYVPFLKTNEDKCYHVVGTVIEKKEKYSVFVAGGEEGICLYGPYVTLESGKYVVKFSFSDYPEMRYTQEFDVCEAFVEIFDEGVIESKKITSKMLSFHNEIKLDFSLEKECIVEFKVKSYGRVCFSVNGETELYKSTIESKKNTHIFRSFSQAGEDLIISFIFDNIIRKTVENYIDIGANDPVKGSNTYYFYKYFKARGICIDANSSMVKKYKEHRPEDIVINACIIGKRKINEELIDFYILNEDGLSSNKKENIDKYIHNKNASLDRVEKVKTITFEDILNQYLNNTQIDFLSMDIEGMEGEILSSIDFSKFRPKVLCIETIENDGNNNFSKNKDIKQIVERNNYSVIADTFINTIFIDNKYIGGGYNKK